MTATTAIPAVRPPTITPPNVPPSPTLYLTGAYTLGAGGALLFDANLGLVCTTALTVTNAGTIAVISSSVGDTVGIGSNVEGPSTYGFVNQAGGLLEVQAKYGTAYGYRSMTNIADISNSGTIEVVALAGEGVGVEGYGSYGTSDVENSKTGLIDVWASGLGIGLDFYQFGAGLTNQGSIVVNAGTAIGVIDIAPFDNSGTIVAASTVSGASSIGVEITSGAVQSYSPDFMNSGLIEAATAIYLAVHTQEPPLWTDITIDNSGTIEGAIVLSTGDDTVINTGTITGAVNFGRGNVTFDGAGGVLKGPIYLGDFTNLVTLGSNAETVFGNPYGGADTITGGAGNDFIEIFRGDNTIDGGGGLNTVSFAGANAGVTVNLATGIATGVGADTISHIHTVIGATGHDNVLIAGTVGAELIAGTAQDTLIGGKGDDILVAGAGGDLMTGGAGSNTFVFQAGDHTLIITDFGLGGSTDALHIYGYSATRSVQQVGANAVITLSATDQIVLENTLGLLTGRRAHRSSSKTVYSSRPWPAGTPPALGTAGITLYNNFQVYAGETLTEGAGGIYDSGLESQRQFSDFHDLTNAGRVVVSGASGHGGAVGLYLGSVRRQLRRVRQSRRARRSRSTSTASATGVLVPTFGPTIINAGTITINGSTSAEGVQSWDPYQIARQQRRHHRQGVGGERHRSELAEQRGEHC